MPPRLHVDAALAAAQALALPPAAARHVQVLRLQPGAAVTLFDGNGGEWSAEIAAMGKREVQVRPIERHAVERELPFAVTLALAMPAGERMDYVVEKATELGASAIQPLLSQRSVLRLAADRADKRRAHWQAVAIAACEQCGRNRVPRVQAPLPLAAWLGALGPPAPHDSRWLLGWHDPLPLARALAQAMAAAPLADVLTLSGPEGGFTLDEEALAASRGFVTVGLGPRVLRADTAPLAALAALALHATTA
jgi:16S rRNA (uracil1498-N3)-methyltransferase